MARTYTLESVEAKIENVSKFIRRADKKKIQLASLLVIRAGLLSPENLVKAETRLERMQKDIARLEASVKASKAIQADKALADNPAPDDVTAEIGPSAIAENDESDEYDPDADLDFENEETDENA